MMLRVRQLSSRFGLELFCGILAVIFGLFSAGAVQADVITQLYSFETIGPNGGPENFIPNDGGVYTQDVIGATHGEHSLKVNLATDCCTFVGAVTDIIPAALNDPPGVDYILFDLTLVQEFGPPPPPPALYPGYADIGVTIFGRSKLDYPGGVQEGLQVQFLDYEPVGGKAVGTYNDIRIDLDLTYEGHPLGSGDGFNAIFGTEDSDNPDDVIPTGFQIYFNKNIGATYYGLTVYIDNVRAGRITEGVPGDFNGDSKVDAADYTVWRNNLGTNNSLGGNGNESGTSAGVVDQDDYLLWKQEYGGGSPGSGGLSAISAPEPGSLFLFVGAFTGLFMTNRGRRS